MLESGPKQAGTTDGHSCYVISHRFKISDTVRLICVHSFIRSFRKVDFVSGPKPGAWGTKSSTLLTLPALGISNLMMNTNNSRTN